MNKSRALIIENKNYLDFRELPLREVGDYEVLFRTHYCSLCTVDRRTYLGTRNYKLPFLGGHECSGTVEKVGQGVVDLKVGDHAIFTAAFCGQCVDCRTGKGTQCKLKKSMPKKVDFEGGILGAGLSEYQIAPSWQVIKVPKDIELINFAMTEPLACCIHSVNKADIKFGDKVLIIGFGIMGYFHLKLVQMRGGIPIVIDIDDSKLAMAKEEGAYVVNSGYKEWKKNIREYLKDGADVIFNTIASASIWRDAIELLNHYGKLVAYSSQDEKKDIGVDFGALHSLEHELIGTVNPTLYENELAIRLISENRFDMKKVIDSVYKFEDGKKAFERACVPNIFRVVIAYNRE